MRNLRVGLVLSLCLLWTGAVWAAQVAAVPQTGQDFSYATGDDGALQKGVQLPTPRFTDKGDGTIKDNLTGLIWLKNADCVGSLTWPAALEFVNNLNTGQIISPLDCGDISGRRGGQQTDWRLPNIREMLSLIDFAFSSPAISNAAGIDGATDGDPFTHLRQTYYWTSTTSAAVTDHAWVVNVTDGFVGFDVKNDVNHSHPVIPVRGGR